MQPKVQAHIDRACADSRLVEELLSKIPQTDWIIVVRFYSALHFAQAYLLTKGNSFEAKRHVERADAIRKLPELRRKFAPNYRKLKDVSEQVRYDAGFNGTAEIRKSALWLTEVRAVVCPALGQMGYKFPN